MIKAVIFDLNGIFIIGEKLSEKFERDFKIPKDIFLPKLSYIMDCVRKPRAGKAFSYFEPALKEWGVTLTEQEFWTYWFSSEKLNEEMLSLAKELKQRGISLFILSNNFKERADYYGHYEWLKEVFDKVYFSWQTGFVKPDPKAWQNLLSENNLASTDCLYFDDQEKNLKSAEVLGIPSFKFEGAPAFKKVLETYLKQESIF